MDTRRYPHARKTGSGATRKTDEDREDRCVRQALQTHSDSFNDTSRRRRSSSTNTSGDTLQRQILNTSIGIKYIGNCIYSGAKPDRCGMSQIGKRLCLVMNPGLFWGQMITVYGVRRPGSGTIPPHYSGPLPALWCNGLA
ncbi:hypothetical protein TNCV_186951 [Trichonephila clavipes]|nr:hypothetical protein TNCV_186951 [Trichonephila clavipes]